jgi:hypothetical protein
MHGNLMVSVINTALIMLRLVLLQLIDLLAFRPGYCKYLSLYFIQRLSCIAERRSASIACTAVLALVHVHQHTIQTIASIVYAR